MRTRRVPEIDVPAFWIELQETGRRHLCAAVRRERRAAARDHGTGTGRAVKRHRSEPGEAPEALPEKYFRSRINIGESAHFLLAFRNIFGDNCFVAIDRKQLPESAEVLQQMVLDLIA